MTRTLSYMAGSIDASETLRRLLSDTGMTQEEFARANDVGVVTVNRWVNGRVRVPERKLAKAISAVGADPADYGIARAVLRDPGANPVTMDEEPAWFTEAQDALHAKLDMIIRNLEHMRAP